MKINQEGLKDEQLRPYKDTWLGKFLIRCKKEGADLNKLWFVIRKKWSKDLRWENILKTPNKHKGWWKNVAKKDEWGMSVLTNILNRLKTEYIRKIFERIECVESKIVNVGIKKSDDIEPKIGNVRINKTKQLDRDIERFLEANRCKLSRCEWAYRNDQLPGGIGWEAKKCEKLVKDAPDSNIKEAAGILLKAGWPLAFFTCYKIKSLVDQIDESNRRRIGKKLGVQISEDMLGLNKIRLDVLFVYLGGNINIDFDKLENAQIGVTPSLPTSVFLDRGEDIEEFFQDPYVIEVFDINKKRLVESNKSLWIEKFVRTFKSKETDSILFLCEGKQRRIKFIHIEQKLEKAERLEKIKWIRIGPLKLGDLPRDKSLPLTSNEGQIAAWLETHNLRLERVKWQYFEGMLKGKREWDVEECKKLLEQAPDSKIKKVAEILLEAGWPLAYFELISEQRRGIPSVMYWLKINRINKVLGINIKHVCSARRIRLDAFFGVVQEIDKKSVNEFTNQFRSIKIVSNPSNPYLWIEVGEDIDKILQDPWVKRICG